MPSRWFGRRYCTKPAQSAQSANNGARFASSQLDRAVFMSATVPLPGGGTRLAIPAYFRPGPQWERLTELGGNTVGVAVMNCASGPGEQPDLGYLPVLEAARASGVEVLGYIDTDNGHRPRPMVLDDISRYREWYGITGYFLDRVHVPCDVVRSYYVPLREHLKSHDAGTMIVLNPGVAVPRCFLDVADVLVDFEGSALTYVASDTPEWRAEYDSARFWHIVYDVAGPMVDEVLAAAARQRAGWLFVTDQALDGGGPGRYLYDRMPDPAIVNHLRNAPRLS
ncbi:MAG: spherulation-specific family 4 protein [Ilumatobacteraceae bacterium]